MIELKVMSKSVNNVVLCQSYKNAFTFDPLFLFEGTSTGGPATSSSCPAPSEILLLDVLRSTVAPAKS